jgi:hypothetical protein
MISFFENVPFFSNPPKMYTRMEKAHECTTTLMGYPPLEPMNKSSRKKTKRLVRRKSSLISLITDINLDKTRKLDPVFGE